MVNVEDVLKYEFSSKHLLVQALTHKSYADFQRSHRKMDLIDYNLLEFLGDSILNYIVLDFFYRHSRYFRHSYPPDALHKLKSEITKNDFLSLIMIENGLHTSILKHDSTYKDQFDYFVGII
jgi:ribonuclease III